MVDDFNDNSSINSRRYIVNSYANLLVYYRDKGIGKTSEITGAVITEDLINAIERRYKQLGGNPAFLYIKASMPTPNGQLNKKEPKR
tara:strand:- start:754 stop:1014 length:261 start_codon:yes stop_codon:yes gene_type:complete